ncbi:hypothetical protein HZC08_01735 [Candidatus Micrarchaeota archaeon]|nr:hypothetical protein [Candidatus Micrarchaeota archaeon]
MADGLSIAGYSGMAVGGGLFAAGMIGTKITGQVLPLSTGMSDATLLVGGLFTAGVGFGLIAISGSKTL